MGSYGKVFNRYLNNLVEDVKSSITKTTSHDSGISEIECNSTVSEVFNFKFKIINYPDWNNVIEEREICLANQCSIAGYSNYDPSSKNNMLFHSKVMSPFHALIYIENGQVR